MKEYIECTVQLRFNFMLAHKQFTRTLEPFTRACIELLVASVFYLRATHARLLDDLWGLFLTWLRMLTIIDTITSSQVSSRVNVT